ncbi:YtxH domain-containing protein [Sulfurimonas sp.]|uniref:YtxH domain-containing protein n=1 Tax=Sulfurimonas sp. TaxID=2022749 RepID=UPI0025CF733E|nr:YtxH domain-containing protein [Sulfurimonas sp.]
MNSHNNDNNFKQATLSNNPYINNNKSDTGSNFMNQNIPKTGFSAAEILTGALIGAAATYILTNENVQKTIFKGMVSMGDVISGGIDEMKERFEDAKAEHEAAKEA